MEKKESAGKKKGFLSLLKESLMKSNEGCGPECGCHAAEKKKTKPVDVAKSSEKNKK